MTPKTKRVTCDLDAATQAALDELRDVVADIAGDRTIAAAVRYAVLNSARALRDSRS